MLLKGMDIRPEIHTDIDAIYQLTQTAFAPMPYSDGDEGACINKLRADGDLTVSLVAVEAEAIVGHVAFSPVTIAGVSDNWFGLGPVSVAPKKQKTITASDLWEMDASPTAICRVRWCNGCLSQMRSLQAY